MTDDGRVFPVKAVLASSRLNDLALLKVDADGLQPLARRRRRIHRRHGLLPFPSRAGQGNDQLPLHFQPGHRFRQVHAPRRQGSAAQVLAVTTDYGPGSSGGPILNEHGAVVGVACQAIPLSQRIRKKRADDLAVQPPLVQHPGHAEQHDVESPPVEKETPPAASRRRKPRPSRPLRSARCRRRAPIPSISTLQPGDLPPVGYYRPITNRTLRDAAHQAQGRAQVSIRQAALRRHATGRCRGQSLPCRRR